MSLVEIVADDDRVHDRENPRAAKVILLARAIIRKQPNDIGMAVKRARQIGADDGVNFAGLEEIAQ